VESSGGNGLKKREKIGWRGGMDKLAIRGKFVKHFKTEPLAKVDVSSFPRNRKSRID
jgi:hypothetical protein